MKSLLWSSMSPTVWIPGSGQASSDKRLGLLINFGEHLIKHGIKRIANGMPGEPPAF